MAARRDLAGGALLVEVTCFRGGPNCRSQRPLHEASAAELSEHQLCEQREIGKDSRSRLGVRARSSAVALKRARDKGRERLAV